MKHPIEDEFLKFGMKNLILEKELEKIQKNGIDIGYESKKINNNTVDTELFEHEILVKAKRMADFYVIYFCLENSIRKLISDVLNEKYGINWWDDKVPDDIKKEVIKKQKKELETSMSIRSDDSLSYLNFGELITIFDSNWKDFKDLLRSQRSVQDVLSQFNKIRNVIAHSCELHEDEISRFKLLVKDWLRIQA